MPRVWQMIHSFFTGAPPSRRLWQSRIPVVALVANEQDRQLLARVSSLEPLEMHFVASRDEASSLANELTAPVILLDRDWPGTEWRVMVQNLAASPHQACVVLVSALADDHLWQELVRQGGYDILVKPLREEDVNRVIKLAVSYWISITRTAMPSLGSGK
jgi:FixJ family two-component response regulator